MPLPIKIIGALAVIGLSFWVTLTILDYFFPLNNVVPSNNATPSDNVAPLCPQGKRTLLKPPYTLRTGDAYIAQLSDLVNSSDTNNTPSRSQLLLCEDNRLLGPAHALHADIERLGRGRFSHWEGSIIFSTYDNTNPNTNKRQYSFVIPDAVR